MGVVNIFDEIKFLNKLCDRSVDLIGQTRSVPAIKKLISIHDILNFNISIQDKYKGIDGTLWDFASLYDLNTNRRELVIYHRNDFSDIISFGLYSSLLLELLKRIKIQNENENLGKLE